MNFLSLLLFFILCRATSLQLADDLQQQFLQKWLVLFVFLFDIEKNVIFARSWKRVKYNNNSLYKCQRFKTDESFQK